ncbi:hypothetical protein CVT26_005201 [Gymnopilus dilepis]|uniref:Uncharacterized protein n=1 Tax=Gymnopilus dilepis TaxID=231916 RepID=A0A409WH76_9AGAR|nr:hypothetical protein CVT26_005201 [Gymnopilus dilepis]
MRVLLPHLPSPSHPPPSFDTAAPPFNPSTRMWARIRRVWVCWKRGPWIGRPDRHRDTRRRSRPPPSPGNSEPEIDDLPFLLTTSPPSPSH